MGLRTENQREEGKVFPIKRGKDRETGRIHVGSSNGHQSGTLMLGEGGDGRTDKESRAAV